MFIGIVEDLSTMPATWYAATEKTDLSRFGLDAGQSDAVHDYFHWGAPKDFPPQEVIDIGNMHGVRFRVIDATIARDVLGLLNILGYSRPVRVCETYRLHTKTPDMTLIVPPDSLGRAIGLLVDAETFFLGLDGSNARSTKAKARARFSVAVSYTFAGITCEIYLIRQLTNQTQSD